MTEVFDINVMNDLVQKSSAKNLVQMQKVNICT